MEWWKWLLAAAGGIVVWEAAWGLWVIREVHLQSRRAQEAAAASGKPLLVVGRPDVGMTSQFGGGTCGDVCVDIGPNGCPTCPVTVSTSVEDLSMFQDRQFGVALAVHLLEHVENPEQGLAELNRVADQVFIAYPRAWTINGFIHPTHCHWMGESDGDFWFKRIPGRVCDVPFKNLSGGRAGSYAVVVPAVTV